jgi:hypothetical protein
MPKGKHENHAKGPLHSRWNQERKKSSHGYVKVRVGVDHPLADPNGYAYEHLVVWISAGNPRPSSDEVIHHRNGQKDDNRLQNLEVKKRYDHSLDHHGNVSDDVVRSVREAYCGGLASMPELANKYHLPIARISRYVRGECRLSAGGPVSTDNRVGTASAGRLLDGVTHDAFPDAAGEAAS